MGKQVIVNFPIFEQLCFRYLIERFRKCPSEGKWLQEFDSNACKMNSSSLSSLASDNQETRVTESSLGYIVCCVCA